MSEEKVCAKGGPKHGVEACVKLKIRKLGGVLLGSYLAVVIAVLVVGFCVGCRTTYSPSGRVINPDADTYGESFPEHDDRYVGWFGVTFTNQYEGWGGYRGRNWKAYNQVYPLNITIVVLIFTAFLAAPFAVILIYKRKCKITSLTITESQVAGSYSLFLSQKHLEIPIDDLWGLMIKPGFMDKMLCGDTLEMKSVSHGVIMFPCVQNADEVVSATREIMENRKNNFLKMSYELE